MNLLLQELRIWGCDIDGAMERFMEDSELYETCLYTVLKDPAFEGLGKALREKKVQEAFDCAHTLKGVLANMGLTPMYEIVVRILEPLRAGNDENLLPVYQELLASAGYLRELLGGSE